MKLNEQISKIRKENGLTQEELASLSKLTVRTIQRIESGKSFPRSFTLKAIAKVLGLPYEMLVTDGMKPGYIFTVPYPREIRHFLQVFNLSCFSYLVLPWVHFLVPGYLLKKREDLDERVIAFAQKIIRQQIFWGIALHLTLLFTVVYNYIQVNVLNHTGYINYLWPVFAFCFLNAGLILVNAILIRKRF